MISKSYFDILIVQQLLHILEFHCCYLVRVEQLCPPINLVLHSKDLEALMFGRLASKLFALSLR